MKLFGLFLIFYISALPSVLGQPQAQQDTKIYAALTLDSNFDERPLDFEVNVKGWICMDYGRTCDTTVSGNSTAILINYYVVVKQGETTSLADLYIDQRIRTYQVEGFHDYSVLESYRISPHFSQDLPTSSSETTQTTQSTEATVAPTIATTAPTAAPSVASSETAPSAGSTAETISSTTQEVIPSSTQQLITIIATIRVNAQYESVNIANFTSKALERLSQWFLGYKVEIVSVKSGSIITDYSITFPPGDRDRVSSLVQFLAQSNFIGYPVLSSNIQGEEVATSNANNSSGNSSSSIGPIVGGVVGGVVLIAVIAIIAAVLIHKKKKKEKKGDIEAPKGTSHSEGSSLKGDFDSMDRIPLLKNISIGDELGNGKFGMVYKGIWNGTTPVALKINRSDQGQDEFVNEMNILTKLNHPNVVRAIGLYVENEQTYLVLEYLSKGSLIDFLRQPSIEKGIGSIEKINMCIHVAAGMGYLEDRQVIHRDLAARNLLVTEVDGKFLLKIADFGLSKESTIYTAKGEQFPVKWSPPEVIQRNQYSSHSDVWSFGIVMWEIFSGGVKIPYFGLSNIETVQYVIEGKRLEKPADCPEEIYALMLKCWNENPNERPTFDQIFKELTVLLDQKKMAEMGGSQYSLNSQTTSPFVDDKIQLYEFTSGPLESKYGFVEDPKYIRTGELVNPKSPSARHV
eukprot:TRINITY_DN29_c0_g1_i1.p1 TRINITY_DN29_c0_g1~~TRINITY_DN29_c0_g1_i1.p1  ORF type:complete len:687 (-),score=240.71 TRINITY_DN29_c0_g1_i1:43-2103(-)